MPPTVHVRFEQAVYGSFSFWDRGYAILAQSPGCRPEWLADLRTACQRLGERPRDAAEAGGLFWLRLASGPWMIVGPSGQGADDMGRPGALAFHALFLTHREFCKVGFDPFPLACALRREWGPETRALPAVRKSVEPAEWPADPSRLDVRWTAAMLIQGRRVAMESAGPIDDLARLVWSNLPERARRRLSVATWAFGNGNRFDLIAVPRLAGIELDPSYVNPAAIEDLPEGGSQTATASPRGWKRSAVWAVATVAIALLAFAVIGPWRGKPGDGRPPSPSPSPSPRPALLADGTPPPARPADADVAADDPEERSRVAEALADLAERFRVDLARDDDPTPLMRRLAERLRYDGPYLSADERTRLAAEPGDDAERALTWDEHVRRFAADRHLPGDFAKGPLRWQLDTLAWSFHLDPVRPRLSAPEIPHALAEALAVEGTIRPNPLAVRYPALADYARFLGRLPRR